MGAGRARLFRLVLIEAVALAMTAALLGAASPTASSRCCSAIGGHAVPRADAVAVGWPVLLFGGARRARGRHRRRAAAGAARVVGRSLHAAQGIAHDAPAASSGGCWPASPSSRWCSPSRSWPARRCSCARRRTSIAVRPGYDTERILAMTVTHVGDRDQGRAFHEQALERVAAVPGVRHAAFAWGVPLTGNSWPAELEVVGRASGSSAIVDRISLPLRSVTEDYFAVMGMRLAEGRAVPPAATTATRRASGSSTRRSSASTSAAAPAIGQQLRFPGNDKPIDDRRRPRRHAHRAAARGAGAGAVPAVLAERRLLEAPRPARRRRSAGAGAAGPRRAARHPADGRRRARHDDGRDPPRSRPRRRRSRCGCWPASRSSRRCSPRSASTACSSLSVGARTKELAVRQAIGARRHQVIAPGARRGRAAGRHRRRLRHRRRAARRPPARGAAVRRGGDRSGVARWRRRSAFAGGRRARLPGAGVAGRTGRRVGGAPAGLARESATPAGANWSRPAQVSGSCISSVVK